MSLYEVGGIILDGKTRYNHRKFKSAHNAIKKNRPVVASVQIADMALSMLPVQEKSGIPYSDTQLSVREWVKENRRTVRGLTGAAPVSAPVAVGINVALTAAEFWSYAVGSYDLRTPAIQRYEESLVLSGMTTRVL